MIAIADKNKENKKLLALKNADTEVAKLLNGNNLFNKHS